MGKIFSGPKMPRTPAMPSVINAPITSVNTANPVTGGDGPPTGTGGSNPDIAPEVTPEEQRVQNILTRNRGRLGTIATSFSGILNNEASNMPIRKTLLGE